MRAEAILIFLLAAGVSLATDSARPRIVVGPNILVSRGESTPHVELTLAAHPWDPRKMLGAGIVATGTDASFACRTYSSADGGYTWRSSSVPEQIEFSGADPQVAFGLHGTAYFSAIANSPDPAVDGVYFYRSDDAGKTWGKGVRIGRGDHDEVVVDRTAGRYAGRVYVGDIGPEDTVQIFRSEDDGRSFIGPVTAHADAHMGLNVLNLLVFSDGSLFVPVVSYESDPRKIRTWNHNTFSSVISEDGGVTFSKPRNINEYFFPEHSPLVEKHNHGSVVQLTFPEFAVDADGKRYTDRVYVAWADTRFGQSRLMFSYSADRGAHWSEQRLLDPAVLANSEQFQPAIAVNKNGVVGIQWFDTRNSPRSDSFDVYFSASFDGGSTFVPATKISSEASYPVRTGNFEPYAWESRDKHALSVHFGSMFNRWPSGGDYMGLAADPTGVFHPFWADSRAGVYQIYTADIAVTTESALNANAATPKLKTDITGDIDLSYDPLQYDVASGEMIIPVRLRNISQALLYGPVHVSVKSLIDPLAVMGGAEDQYSIPEILEGDPPKATFSVTFDYSKALGPLNSLAPGALSEPVPWHVRLSNPLLALFYLEVAASGFRDAPNQVETP